MRGNRCGAKRLFDKKDDRITTEKLKVIQCNNTECLRGILLLPWWLCKHCSVWVCVCADWKPDWGGGKRHTLYTLKSPCPLSCSLRGEPPCVIQLSSCLSCVNIDEMLYTAKNVYKLQIWRNIIYNVNNIWCRITISNPISCPLYVSLKQLFILGAGTWKRM